jgi:hypothetical protein
MSATINFADFLIFTGASEADEVSYATIAAGVLEFVKSVHNLYIDTETITINKFLASNTLSFYLPFAPVVSLTSLTYDGTLLVDETDYTYYGEDVLLEELLDNYRKPISIVANVGYAEGTVPSDLKLAIYRHIEAVQFAMKNKVDGVEKTTNTTGNTTFFIRESVPDAVDAVYNFYTNRSLVLI